MRKLYTFLTLILLQLSLFSQVTLPYSCNFDASTTLPTGWQFLSQDDDNALWAGVTSFAVPYSSPNCFAFCSFINTSDVFDQYLVSPRIVNTTTDSVHLQFYYAAADEGEYQESFRVGFCRASEFSISQVEWRTPSVITSTLTWQHFNVNVPSDAQYVVIHYNVPTCQDMMFVDDILLRADNSEVRYPITVQATAGGTVLPGTTSVPEGSDFSFEVTPDEGYRIVSVKLDGVALPNAANMPSFSYTITGVTTGHQVDVVFEQIRYSIYVTVNGNGTVVPDGSDSFHNVMVAHGQDTTFHFYADAGHHVSDVVVDNGWHGGSISEYTFSNVTANHTLKVSFDVDQFTISASALEGGTITPSGDYPVTMGNDYWFDITPDEGYEIDSIWVDGALISGFTPLGYRYTFHNVAANHSIVAHFSVRTLLVHITHSEGGDVLVAGGTPVGEGIVSVQYGDTLAFTMLPGVGYQFVSLSVDGVSVGSESTYILQHITVGHAIYALFEQQTYTIMANRHGMGTITPMIVSNADYYTESVFTLTPNYCAALDSVLLDGVAIEASSTVTLSQLVGTHYLDAYYSNIYYPMTVLPTEHGVINGDTLIPCGGMAVFTFEPAECYNVAHFYLDGVQRDDLLQNVFGVYRVRLASVDAAHVLSADFEQMDYSVQVSNAGHGTISHEGEQAQPCGSNLHFEIVPDACYRVASFLCNGTDRMSELEWRAAAEAGRGDTAAFDLENIGSNYTISVTFERLQYAIEALAEGAGAVEPSGVEQVSCGSDHQVEITPAPCHRIAEVFVDDVPVSSSLEMLGERGIYHFENVNSPHTLRAEFEMKQLSMHVEQVGSGSVTPIGDSAVVCGSDFSFMAIPASCQQVDSVWIDGALANSLMTVGTNDDPFVGDTLSYRFENIVGDHQVRVVFGPIRYLVSAQSLGNGTVTCSEPTAQAACGESLTFNLYPGDCSVINRVYLNGSLYTDYEIDGNGIGTLNIPAVYERTALSVVFSSLHYQLSVAQPEHGEILYVSSQINCGTDVALGFVPDDCYHIDSIRIGSEWLPASVLTEEGDSYSYLVADVRSDLTVAAAISIDSVRVVAHHSGGLSLGDTLLACGQALNCYIPAGTCAHLDSIVVNGTSYNAETFAALGTYAHVNDTMYFVFDGFTSDAEIAAYLSEESYNLVVNVVGNGSVDYEGVTLIPCGTPVEVQITPDSCHRLASIIYDGHSIEMDNPSSFVLGMLHADAELEFVFEEAFYQVLTQTNAYGTIEGDADLWPCGSDATYKLHPATCARLDSLFADDVLVAADIDSMGQLSYTFESLESSHTLRAVFSLREYQVDVTTIGEMSLNVEPHNDVVCGDTFMLRITPGDCFKFDYLEVDGSLATDDVVDLGDELIYKIENVTADHQVTVGCRRSAYAVTTTWRMPDGSQIAEPVVDSAICGESLSVPIYAQNDCQTVDSILLDGVTIALTDTVELSNIRADANVDIYQHSNVYQIEYQNWENCSLLDANPAWVACGSDYQPAVSVFEGYHLTAWVVDGDTMPTDLILSNVHSNHIVVPVVEPYLFAIHTATGEHGYVSPESPMIPFGESVTLHFLPEDCHQVADVLVDGVSVGSITQYTFEDVAAEHTVSVSFEKQTDTIRVVAGANGHVSVPNENYLFCGDDFEMDIYADECYRFYYVLVDGVFMNSHIQAVGDHWRLVLPSVEENHQVLVAFEAIRYEVATAGNYGGRVDPQFATPRCGSDWQFTITPYDCYRVDSVWINGTYVNMADSMSDSGVVTYTLHNISEDHQISVRYVGISYQFDIENDGAAEVLVSQEESDCAGDISFVIIPNQCEEVTNIYLNDYEITPIVTHLPNANPLLQDSLAFVIQHVSSDTLLRVVSTPVAPKTVFVDILNGDEFIDQQEIEVACGSDIVIPLDYECFELQSLRVNGVEMPLADSILLENILSNQMVVARFEQKQFSISGTITGEGSVSLPASVLCSDDAVVTITPADCYTIGSVEVNGVNVGTVDVYEFHNVRSDETINVTFVRNEYEIAVSANEGGEVSLSGSASVLCDDSRLATIIPDSCHTIASLIVDGDTLSAADSYLFDNITADHTLEALFVRNEYQIFTVAGEGGTLSINGESTVSCGDDRTVSIIPDDCYRLSSLTVNGEIVALSDSYTFEAVTADNTIEAAFVQTEYDVNATAGEGGTIHILSEIPVVCGNECQVRITPDDCYSIESLLVNGQLLPASDTYTFTNVTSVNSIHANFVRNAYTIHTEAAEGGHLVVLEDDTVQCGGSRTVSIVPDECYAVESVFVNGSQVANTNAYTFANVTGDSIIAATFARIPYILHLSAGFGGHISLDGDTTVLCGDSCTVTFTPDACYEVESIIVNGQTLPASDSYTFASVQGDSTLSVTFALTQHHVTLLPAEGGNIQLLSPSDTVSCGGQIAVRVAPDGCYSIESIRVNNRLVSLDYPLTDETDFILENIQGDSIISATFVRNQHQLDLVAGLGGTIEVPSQSVACGDAVTADIRPDDCHAIEYVFVNGVNIGQVDHYTFENVRGDSSLMVTFSQNMFGILSSANVGGQISPVGLTQVPCSGSQAFTFTPNAGYAVDSVLVNGINRGMLSEYTFQNVRGDSSIQVFFSAFDYSITAVAETGGRVFPEIAHAVYGDDVTISVTADDCYAIAALIVDGDTLPAATSYTFAHVTSNHTFGATFVRNAYTLHAEAGVGGQIAFDGDTTVLCGDSRLVSITADDCYRIESLLVNGVAQPAAATYQFENITADNSIVATFVRNAYLVSATIRLDQEVVLTEEMEVYCGDDTIVEIPMFDCTVLDSIVVNGISVATSSPYQLTDVHENIDLTVYLSTSRVSVSVNAQGSGSVTPMGDTMLVCGSDLMLTFTADTGWYVEDILVNGVSLGTPSQNTYTLADIRSDASVVVVFAVNEYLITATVDPIDAGQINPYGTTIVAHGGSVTYHIFPFPTFEIVDVEVDGVSVGAVDTYTFENVVDNHTITAHLAAVGIADVEEGALRVYTSGNILMIRNESQNNIISADVYDLRGRKVVALGSVGSDFQKEMNIAPGAYIVRVETARGVSSHKVVVTHP